MSHENMYVAEKELCKGTLIEIEKLNDVKGIGKQKKRKPKPPPPPEETVLEFRGGVMQRVSMASAAPMPSSHRGSIEPFVAEGAELLAGLSEAERNAILSGETSEVTSSDFARPSAPDLLLWWEQQRDASQARRGRAPAPSWAARVSAAGGVAETVCGG